MPHLRASQTTMIDFTSIAKNSFYRIESQGIRQGLVCTHAGVAPLPTYHLELLLPKQNGPVKETRSKGFYNAKSCVSYLITLLSCAEYLLGCSDVVISVI